MNENVDVITGESNADPEANVIEIESESPPKKRRGRPPKNPQDKLNEESAGTSTREKPGPKKRTRGADASDLLARQLMGIHHMVAMVSGLPVVILSENECKMLADALINVANEYDIAISGKMAAIVQLTATLGMIYVPRLIELNNIKNKRPIVENEHENTVN